MIDVLDVLPDQFTYLSRKKRTGRAGFLVRLITRPLRCVTCGLAGAHRAGENFAFREARPIAPALLIA